MMKFLKKTQSWLNKAGTHMEFMDKRPVFRAAIFFALLLFAACEKPEESVGIDLQPDEDILGAERIDTVSLIAFTIPEDSVRTDPINANSSALLGAYIDQYFGLTKSGHFTEIRLTSSNPVFVPVDAELEDLVVDSIILSLAYEDIITLNSNATEVVYGGLGQQYLQVFEVNEYLYVDSVYYDNRRLDILEEDLIEEGGNWFTPAPEDSVILDGTNFIPQIRVPLKKDLAYELIELSVPNGLSAETFRDTLKGLYITVDETQAGVNLGNTGIISFDTFSSRSRIEMFYRDTVSEDTLFYPFEIRASTGKYNAFDHDFEMGGTNSLVEQVINGNPAPGQQDLYLQAMGGTKIRVDIPHIESIIALKDEYAVSKAELVLPVRGRTVTGNTPPPVGIFIFGLDEEGEAFLLPDQLDGSSFVGGNYDAQNGEYRIAFSRYLQQIMLGEREWHGLEIVARNTASSANRVVINGPEYPDPENPSNNLKLVLSFTKF